MMQYKYYAFISHASADEKMARWLERKLTAYRIPVRNVEDRDKSDLGAYQTVRQGLSDNLASSRFLVVVCSPRSAQSPYVDAEARHFVETGRKENIVPFVIEAGEPASFYPPSLPAGMEPVIASENYLAALKAAEGLWDGELDDERYFAVYADILCHLGDVNEMEGRLGQAVVYYKRSLQASETFFGAHPDSFEGCRRFTESLERIAILGARIGDYEESVRLYSRCGELWEKMRSSWPKENGTRGSRLRYGRYLVNRAMYAHTARGDFNPAIEYMSNALSLFEALLAEEPENFTFRLSCANTTSMLTHSAIKTRDFKTAETFYSSGEKLWRQPGNETFLARKSKIEEYRGRIESEDAVTDSRGADDD